LNGANTVSVKVAGLAEDIIRNIENVTGGSGSDTLTGDGLANTLTGSAGNDTLDGAGGGDTMFGGSGNDIFWVDNAADRVFETAGLGSDTVITTVSYALLSGSDVNLLRTLGSSTTTAINLTGNSLANTLAGNAAANVLDGGAGADTMIGAAGNDTYRVDNALDKVIETAGQGTDTVIATASYALQSGADVNVLRTVGSASTTAINLAGNALGQTIAGNAASNAINGGGGNDTLIGAGGNDFFLFNTALGSGNIDTIVDFNVAADIIRLENAVFAALGAVTGTLAAGAFNTGAAATQADDRIIYNAATGTLIYDTNGNAAGGALQFATLATSLALTNADFVVV
jgi:Ca2+-binding RTX toxin-like protein